MPWLLRNAHKASCLDFWRSSQGLFVRLDFCYDLTRLTDLTFGMAHKACSFALTFAMTSQDLRRHYHFRSDFCLGSQGLYVHLDFCHDSQNWLISKSPWLASGWSLMTSDLGECLLMLISTLLAWYGLVWVSKASWNSSKATPKWFYHEFIKIQLIGDY